MNYKKILFERIKTKKATVGIIGIGYVGGALAQGAAASGFRVFGFTRSTTRANHVNKQKIPNYTATLDTTLLSKCSIICICVPTPIHKDKSPDLKPLLDTLKKTVKYLKSGSLVIIESTVAPGTTRNVVLPILKTSSLKQEDEFFLSFSPERVDPGNKKYTMYNTPKIVSGLSQSSCTLSCEFYKSFIETVVPVSSLEVAEMSKILENTFRFINISFMNELLEYANSLDINLWEVIDASATKPFGFLPHYPGPGIGGHCIPVDPYYLLDDAKKRGVNLGLIEKAGEVNDAQPRKVVERAIDIIKPPNGQKKTHSVLLVGLSYKEDTPDSRESPSFEIWKLLEQASIEVSYHDPYVPAYENTFSEELCESTIKNKDIIILATPHRIINFSKLISYHKPILDPKNALKNHDFPNIYKI
ncbi:MAG: hypothetical protein A2W22_02815 [Candidatus Levybacteria bacterium RBG_16_35_11]|nr:MAG: hypothetical protein A2W22_02815 [Candidatus Levybacteria bacterium RBG_16_35_11]